MTTSCPKCFRPIMVEDMVINNYQGVVNVETCGKLLVKKNGNVIATKRVVAYGGIEVIGRLSCASAFTAGPACIKPKGEWKGDLDAPSVDIQEGAKIHGGRFRIPVDPLAEHRHQEAETASTPAAPIVEVALKKSAPNTRKKKTTPAATKKTTKKTTKKVVKKVVKKTVNKKTSKKTASTPTTAKTRKTSAFRKKT